MEHVPEETDVLAAASPDHHAGSLLASRVPDGRAGKAREGVAYGRTGANAAPSVKLR